MTNDSGGPRGNYIYRLHGEGGGVIYVGRSVNVAQRIRKHNSFPRKTWLEEVRSVSMFGPLSRDEAIAAERREIARLQPPGNIALTARDHRPFVAHMSQQAAEVSPTSETTESEAAERECIACRHLGPCPDHRWICGGCGHEGNGPDQVEWYEHTKVCPDRVPATPEAGDVEALAKAAEAKVWALADELCTTWHDNDGETDGEGVGVGGWLASRWACQECYDTACTMVDTKWLATLLAAARREGGRIACTNCDADDLGCTACGAQGTLAVAR